MSKRIMVIMIALRSKSAIDVQHILTEYGCIIKTRLGIHDHATSQCTESGVIVLEIIGEKADGDELFAKLDKLEDVSVKDVEMSL